jgi:heat shock protein HslJ
MIRALFALLMGSTMAAADVPLASLALQWRLVSMNGETVTARVTIDLSVEGQIAGRAPCNRFAGRYDGPLPAFRPGPMRATKMACDQLALETAFFRALSAVTRAEMLDEGLVLAGNGVRMVFAQAE